MRGEITTIQRAISYVRVSSVAQVKKGHGAESQAARCEEFARMKGYRIEKVFEDKAVSGSLVERPGMQKLLAHLRQNRKDHLRVIIDDISRLARGLEAHLALRAAIAEAGGVLESPSIEFGEDSDSQLIEHLLASVSAHQRGKNAEQTRNRMRARIVNGYWPFAASAMGFKYERRPGHGNVLVRDEPLASIIQEGLEGYASGRFQTQAEVKRFFESQPDFPKTSQGKVRNQLVKDLLTRVLYAGMVERPEWDVPLRDGQHDGLISYETFLKIQERLEGRAYAPARADLNESFPLRGSVVCADCGKPLTACFSKSKTGARHPYYLCYSKGCPSKGKSIRKAEIESEFEAMLETLRPSDALFTMARAMFTDAWEQQRRNGQNLASSLKRSIAQCETQISRLVDRIINASSDSVIPTYEAGIEKLEKEKLMLTEKLQSAGKPRRAFGEMFELAMRFLANPCNLWKSERYEDKQTVLKLVLSAPLEYSRNEGFRTPHKSCVFRLFEGLSPQMRGMAEREGFEPSIRLPVYCISSAAHSTTLPPLRKIR
tara:strand:- start:10185 stop:11816 length:1632 start_codon:yes stop_codon:yes gene_type:complete